MLLLGLGMNRNRKSRNIARSLNDGQAEPNAVFKAVLIYENVTAGARARCCLERLARESGKTLEEQMWNFDVIGIREARNGAASAARKADVVAVSASGQLEFPGSCAPGALRLIGYANGWVGSPLFEAYCTARGDRILLGASTGFVFSSYSTKRRGNLARICRASLAFLVKKSRTSKAICRFIAEMLPTRKAHLCIKERKAFKTAKPNGAKISIAFVEDGGELHAFYDGVLSGMDKPWGGVSWLLGRNGSVESVVGLGR